jgi:hypothetical protein
MTNLLIGIIAASAGGRNPNILTSPTILTNAAWVATAVTKAANGIAETATTSAHFINQSGFSYTAGQVWAL